MGGSIKEYLEHQPTESLEMMLLAFSRTNMQEDYGYAIEIIKEEIRKREE